MLKNQCRLYEDDRTATKNDKGSAAWKAKFDEMFRISQNLIQENQKLQNSITKLRNQLSLLAHKKGKVGAGSIFDQEPKLGR